MSLNSTPVRPSLRADALLRANSWAAPGSSSRVLMSRIRLRLLGATVVQGYGHARARQKFKLYHQDRNLRWYKVKHTRGCLSLTVGQGVAMSHAADHIAVMHVRCR
jgi:hypothetical protein